MNIFNKYALITFGLLTFSCSDIIAQKSQVDETKETAKTFVKAETIKAIESKLIAALEAERKSQAVSKAMETFWDSAKNLSKEEVTALANRYTNASKSNLKKLAALSPKQLSSYARDIAGRVKLDPKILKQIIYQEGDRAGTAILQTLSAIESSLTETGKISAELLKKMRSEAAGLDPKQARAFYDLLKDNVSNDWADIKNLDKATDGIGKYVGTVVDGVFVLKDAYSIYYGDDEPEVKAINATEKIIDYGISTGAGAASTALGGGLGPGLVIAFTANRVSTLYTEIAMLQKEREAATDAEQYERLNNSMLVRRQLVNISNKIKSGDQNNANFLLHKIEQFLFNHKVDNLEKLFELHNELEQKSKSAERAVKINEVINTARFPYRDALNFYNKGVELNQAKRLAMEALEILKSNLKSYPEIGGLNAISISQQLIRQIDEKIAKAEPLIITGIKGPDRVYAGTNIDYHLTPKGGIPYYRAFGEISGNISDDEVTMYWEVPDKAGERKVTFSISDCMGKTATISKTIEVVMQDQDLTPTSDGIKLIAYYVFFDFKTQKQYKVEAHEVYPGSDVTFVVNDGNEIASENYTYNWLINGIKDNSAGKYSEWSNNFYLRVENKARDWSDEIKGGVIGVGITTVCVEVNDSKGHFIGRDCWTVKVKEPESEYLVDPRIPEGDEY